MPAWLTGILIGLLLSAPLAAGERPLFDAHIHYSHDAWDSTPTAEAVARLRQAGIVAALVSSSSDEGTQRLFAAAPDLIRPALRPYQRRGQLTSWLRDPAILAHVEDRLRTHRYVALGEFHVSGADADLPIVRRMVELARQYGLVLHAHSDADAVERLFRQDPKARILWAHAGFEKPETVRALMRRQPNLWADLSFRYDVARGGDIAPEWKSLLLEFPDRFMVGTDTYTPERWREVGEHAAWARDWLDKLPPEAAARIARDNAEALFPPIGR
ncbi:amidohydrolase [Paramagnetospirillum marisnigri]|uniref:Amidohydrolase n=1 Tax=Paramagnetospirillum marisnigri TaxID=1285242 RepID=A0A178N0F0_9PROT|nr:amidohydrolase family protein [Paramagnetospirillum marisnigri]OAN56050.1 amidohydrolase [Paramagnetospirillum marisnigri]